MLNNFSASSLAARWFEQNQRVLVQGIVVSGVLLASAYFAHRPSVLYLVVMLGLAFSMLVLRWPALGLLALVPASLLIPFSVSTGTETTLNAVVLLLPLLFGLWALDTLAQRDNRLATARPFLPLLALSLVAVLAFVNGNQVLVMFAQTAPMPAQAGGLATFLLSAGAFLIASQWLRDVRWLQSLTWLFLAVGGVYVIGRIMPGTSSIVDHFYQRAATANSIFWVWLVALAFGQAVYNRSLRWPWRLALMGLAAVTLFVGFFQARDWVSGWLPPAVTLVVTLGIGKPRLALLLALLGGLVVVADYHSIAGLASAIESENSYSTLTRVDAWQIIAGIVKASPILGLGPANYYWYTPLYPILGWHVNFNSHNNYVDIVAQTGLLGLACFLWFAWETGRLGLRVRANEPTEFGRAYAYGALGGLAGMLVAGMLADWVIPFVYNIGLAGFRTSVMGWIFLGGLAALSLKPMRDMPIPAEQV